MSQDGSIPGRPRGHRARHGKDAPDWQGYDATPAAERGWPEGGYAASGGYPAGESGYPGAAAGHPPTGPGQLSADPFGADQFSTGPFAPARHAGTQPPQGYPGGFGQPGLGQVAPGQASQGQPGQGQGTAPQAARAAQPEEDIPSWAEPDTVEAFSERWRRRGLDSRDDRRADRRRRRRLLFAGGGVAAVVIGVAAYFLAGGGSSATPGFGNLITSFLPGELQQVPDACDTVPAAMLNQYLNGTRKVAAPPLNTGANTQCTWTLDNPPTYRVLEVQIEAYSPSALYGNGSATDAAELNYESFEQGFAKPGPKSGQPPATVTDLSGMPGGTDTSAFQASQVFNREGAITDVASVLVRYRNVIITVVVDGLDQAKGKKTYGPVAMGDLTSAAQSVARQVAGQVVG